MWSPWSLVCLAAVVALLTPGLAQPQQAAAGSYFADEGYGYNEAPDKRVPSAAGFHGMRGKKDLDDLEEKRAPASGFVGMRGKKFGDQDADLDFYEKRAPSAMGFQGMRGKKGGFPDDGDVLVGDKRVGFVGMRGKKQPGASEEEDDVDPREIASLRNMLLGGEAFKRAPSQGFLGLRGKKAPSQGFLGLRGKKAPSDSSFFGMRGKKASELEDEAADSQGLDQLLAYLSDDLEQGRLRQKRFPNNIKKKPSGFLGMRGKKYWVDTKDVAFLEGGGPEARPVQ